jgi:hypothetical protein
MSSVIYEMNIGPKNMLSNSELLFFWTLPTVRYSKNKRIQRFGNWICFHPQVSGRHLLCWAQVQWLRLAVSNGPIREGISPFTWGQKQIQLPKRCILQFFEYRTMGKVQKPSNSECYTPSSEPFKIYFFPIVFYFSGLQRTRSAFAPVARGDRHIRRSIILLRILHAPSSELGLKAGYVNWRFACFLSISGSTAVTEYKMSYFIFSCVILILVPITS